MIKQLIVILLSLSLLSCSHQPQVNAAAENIKDDTTHIETKVKPQRLMSVIDEIGVLPASLSEFVPPGYAPLDTASGDLNMDGVPDMILVLKPINEDTIKDERKRPVIILIGDSNGHYKLQARNDNVAYCYRCGGVFGDPFTGITIKNNYFSIENGISAGTHWEHILTFKYDKDKADWLLSRDGYVSYKLNPDTNGNAEALIKDVEKIKTSKDFSDITFSKFDIHNDWK